MEKNKRKFGTIFDKKTNITSKDTSFFGGKSSGLFSETAINPISKNENTNISEEKQKFINDFDSSLILENIDKNVKNKAVKLNLKINALEKNLARINEELELVKLLNLEKDQRKRIELTRFKDYLEKEIANLKDERKKYGILYSICGFLGDNIDCDAIRDSIHSFKEEIIRYDKIAISYIKAKNAEFIPFKW